MPEVDPRRECDDAGGGVDRERAACAVAQRKPSGLADGRSERQPQPDRRAWNGAFQYLIGRGIVIFDRRGIALEDGIRIRRSARPAASAQQNQRQSDDRQISRNPCEVGGPSSTSDPASKLLRFVRVRQVCRTPVSCAPWPKAPQALQARNISGVARGRDTGFACPVRSVTAPCSAPPNCARQRRSPRKNSFSDSAFDAGTLSSFTSSVRV